MQVSVLIPAYNAERYIERAVASVLVQTERDLEIIAVDDASSDRTCEIVLRLCEQDHRVRLLRAPVNLGPSAARNLALSHARGVWVAQLDADDSYEPERLARLLALGEAQQADIVSDNVLMCPDDGSASPSPMVPQNIWPTARLLTAAEFVAGNIGDRRNPRMSLGFMMPIFRRAFLERNKLRYDERNRFGEDFMLYLACLVHGARWWVEPAAMYRYTIRNGSLTEVQTAADLQRIRTFEQDLLRDCPLAHSNPAFAHALRRHKSKIDRCYYYRAFTDAVKARQITHARRVLFESPSGFRHIMQESLAQMPVITAKALRGGYRAKPSSRRAISG